MRRNVSESIAVMLETDDVSLIELRRGAHLARGAARRASRPSTRRTRRPRELLAAIAEAEGNHPASEAFRIADTRFHRVIASAARNELLRAFTSWTLDVLQPSLIDTIGASIDGDAILDQHRVIQRAIRLRQPAAAQRAMRRHLDYLRELVGSLDSPDCRGENRESGTHARVPPAARVRRAADARARAPDRRASSGSAAPGVCATDLHAIEGLMEPAGVTLPRVLGHENAGWVEEVGDGVTTVAKGDAVLVYPPYSCGLCVPCRRGNDMHCVHHEFTGLTVDGGFADYVLVAERSLAAPARRRRAGRGRAARRRRADRVPRRAAAGAPRRPGHDGRRDRRRRRRSHRAAAPARARRERHDRDRHRRTAPRARRPSSAPDEVLDGAGSVDAVRELTGGRGADLVFDFVGTDQSHADSHGDARPRRHVLGHRLRRHGLASRRRRWSATSTTVDRQPRRHLDRPLGAHAAARRRAARAQDRDAPAGLGQRRAREAARRRGHRARGARALLTARPSGRSGVDRDRVERRRGRLAAQEVGRAQQLGLLRQLLGRALVADAAALEHVGLVREPERDVRELLDQEDADAGRGDGLEHGREALDDDRREPERQLVDEDHARVRDERLREHDHLLLAAREQAAGDPPALLELGEELERARDPALRVLAWRARRSPRGGCPRP